MERRGGEGGVIGKRMVPEELARKRLWGGEEADVEGQRGRGSLQTGRRERGQTQVNSVHGQIKIQLQRLQGSWLPSSLE